MKHSIAIIFCYVLFASYLVVCVFPAGDFKYTVTNDRLSCDNESSCVNVNELSKFSDIERVSVTFCQGRHILNRSKFIVFENISEVHIIGDIYGTEILCSSSSGLMISSVHNLIISNLSFLSCGGLHHAESTFSTIFLHLVSNFILENLRVIDSSDVGIFISNAYGMAQIYNSHITGSQKANIVCIWNYSSNVSSSFFDFLVENLTITNGGIKNLNLQAANDVSGGMNIKLDGTTVPGKIFLGRIILYNNSAHTGGNLKVDISRCIGANVNITLSHALIDHGRAYVGGGLSFTRRHHCDLVSSASYNGIHLTILDTNVTNNQAVKSGGGMSIIISQMAPATNIHMHALKFVSNTLLPEPTLSKQFLRGGGLYYHLIQGGECTFAELVISECVFENNSAYSGAGMYTVVDKAFFTQSSFTRSTNMSSIVIDASHFVNNHANYGAGAVILTNDMTTLLHCVLYKFSIVSSVFEANTASTQASGLLISLPSCSSAEISMDDTVFTRNTVTLSGISLHRFPSTLYLYFVTNISISHCSFHQNTG